MNNDLFPIGFASINWNIDVSNFGIAVASNKYDLQNLVKRGNCIIYVDGNNGIIDMSEGILPKAGQKSTDFNEKLDEWIYLIDSKYSTYKDWFNEKSNCSLDTHEKVSKFSLNFTDFIKIAPESNTIIIGINNAIIRGGSMLIENKQNVIIKNITFQDGIDPFPRHEKNDGFNARNDCIGIDNSSNIWIDHCTFEDTLTLGAALNGEDWQIYDGLCDIKNDSTNITISYCIFKNHNKAMLIGSSDLNGDNKKRFITIQNNYFLNCKQRCPMVRNSRIHIFNNVYENVKITSINARKDSIVCSQNNFFKNSKDPIENDGVISSDDSSIFDIAPKYKYTLKDESLNLKDDCGPRD